MLNKLSYNLFRVNNRFEQTKIEFRAKLWMCHDPDFAHVPFGTPTSVGIGVGLGERPAD